MNSVVIMSGSLVLFLGACMYAFDDKKRMFAKEKKERSPSVDRL